jgi:hypothetical protein
MRCGDSRAPSSGSCTKFNQIRLDFCADVNTARNELAGKNAVRLAVRTEDSNPDVVMVKSAQNGVRTYEAGSLNRTRDRRILVQ